jgi:L-rhamnose mutarotase
LGLRTTGWKRDGWFFQVAGRLIVDQGAGRDAAPLPRETRIAVSRRMCFALDLVNDAALIREYCRMHEPGSVWAAVIEHIRAQGVEALEIWQRSDRLFMIMEAADDYPRHDASEVAQRETVRWEAYMATFQRILPDATAGDKWSSMQRIFVLSDHKGLSKS